MNEHIFLTPLRESQLSEREKQFIRTNVLAGQRKSLFLRKLFFASRITGYVAVSTFGIFVLVSSYIPQPATLNPENGPLFTIHQDSLQATVQADTIGRLLEIQWVVHVIKNGIIVPKTDIAAGEIVVLQPGAELVIQIRDTTFAKITWPAKFVLEYIPELQQTVLNLLEGKLIEVTTKITPLVTEEKITPQKPESQELAKAVIIKTKFVEVTPPANQTTTFVIEQQDKQAEVIAKSGNILVKQLLDTTDSATQLFVDAWEAAHIDTKWIALFVPETDDQLVQLALESRNLQIRYEAPTALTSVVDETILPDVWNEEDITLLAVVQSPVEVEDEVLEQLTKRTTFSDESNEKKILTPELVQSLTQTLHTNISTQNIAQMKKWKWVNINAYIIAYSNLLEQLNRAYTLLWAPQPATSTDSLDAWIHITQNLLTLLETTYSTPPSLRNALQSIIAWLTDMQTTPETWTEVKEATTTIIEELKKITE